MNFLDFFSLAGVTESSHRENGTRPHCHHVVMSADLCMSLHN